MSGRGFRSGGGGRRSRSNSLDMNMDSASISTLDPSDGNDSNKGKTPNKGNISPAKGEKKAASKTNTLLSPGAGRGNNIDSDDNSMTEKKVLFQAQINKLETQSSDSSTMSEDDKYNLCKLFLTGEEVDQSLLESLSDYEGNRILDGIKFAGEALLEAAANPNKKQHFVKVDTRVKDMKYLKNAIAFIFDFPVPGTEKDGPLGTRGRNNSPQNATAWALTKALTVTLHEQYGIHMNRALVLSVHLILWVNILPITLPSDSAGSTSSTNADYKTLRDECDKHAKVYIRDVLIQSGVTRAVIMGSHVREYVDDNPEAIPSHVEVLQKCDVVHTSKIAMGGATEREVYDLLNTLSIIIADILGEAPKPNISVERITSYFLTQYDSSLPEGSSRVFYRGKIGEKEVMTAHSRKAFEALLRKELKINITEKHPFPPQRDIETGADFRGLTLELVPFYEFDHTTDKFGTIDCEELRDWVTECNREREADLAEHSKKCESAHDNMLGAM